MELDGGGARSKPVASQAMRELRQEIKRVLPSGLLGDKTLESGFFQRCLAKSRGSTPTAAAAVARRRLRPNPRSCMPLQGRLSCRSGCAGMAHQLDSRTGFLSVRGSKSRSPREEDMEVRSAIH